MVRRRSYYSKQLNHLIESDAQLIDIEYTIKSIHRFDESDRKIDIRHCDTSKGSAKAIGGYLKNYMDDLELFKKSPNMKSYLSGNHHLNRVQSYSLCHKTSFLIDCGYSAREIAECIKEIQKLK